MSSFQVNRHHSEDCGASGSECSSAVVILKLSVKTELFEKALGFVKERLVETRAFQVAKNARLRHYKRNLTSSFIKSGTRLKIKKNMPNGERRRECSKPL